MYVITDSLYLFQNLRIIICMLVYTHICIDVFPIDSCVLQYSMLLNVCDMIIECTIDCSFTWKL